MSRPCRGGPGFSYRQRSESPALKVRVAVASGRERVRTCKGISGLELPNLYEMLLQKAEGERVEIPWDLARHYCDDTYRPTAEAIATLER